MINPQLHAHPGRWRSVHVLDSIEEEASGPSYSVPALCRTLRQQGAHADLLTIGDAFIHDYSKVPILRKLRFSADLNSGLRRAAARCDVIHAHGLWLMPNIYPARAAIEMAKPLVVSPRGMLGKAALRFSLRKKQLFWHLAQRQAMRAASCVHATSQSEYDSIRAFGIKTPVAVIPNGIDVPEELNRPPPTGARTLLYLGRLHPKKGLSTLVEAWRQVEGEYPEWQLDIAGPIDTYGNELQTELRVSASSRARLVGPLYGSAKSDAYSRADLFVLPTLNENFGMTVAEALAHGTPAISTKGAPWAGLEANHCGWWIDHGTDALAATLRHAMALDRSHLAAMGASGRNWMLRDFGWHQVARSMLSVYGWLASRDQMPSCVVID